MAKHSRQPEQLSADGAPIPFPPPAQPPERFRVKAASQPTPHRLSARQISAICRAMQLFVDEDLAKGLAFDKRLYCDACARARPAAGFIQYDRYCVCNGCAIEYEIARARGLITSAGQFVRDKQFGEEDHYAVSLPPN